jgi:hypothetical protein
MNQWEIEGRTNRAVLGKDLTVEKPVLNIYQRLNEVRRTNEYIKKDKEVDGKYKVVSHDRVTAAVRGDLIKHGIIIVPYMVEGRVVQDTLMMTARKQPIIRFEGVYDVRFVNADDPKDVAVVRVPAHALDTGDKAPGKSCSYAVKMAMLKIFSIETGEEDEDRKEKDASADGLDDGALADWSAKIDELGGKTPEEIGAAAQKLWEEIHAKVNEERKDVTSGTKLRARLTARVSALKRGLKK